MFPFFLSDTPFTAEDFLRKIIPNFWSFLIQLLALVVLIVAVYFLAYKPVRKLVEKRRNYVNRNLKGSEEALKHAEYMEKAAKGNISDSRIEASKIVEEGRKEGERQKNEMLEKGKAELAKEREKARLEIEREREEAEKALRATAADLAVDAAEAILDEKADKARDRKLAEDFMKKGNKDGK